MKPKWIKAFTSVTTIGQLPSVLFLPILLSIFSIFISGCTASSSDPSFSEIIKTPGPNFNGHTTASFTTATENYVLNGDCNMKAQGLQWSYDNSTWTTVTGGCVNSTFSINVVVPHQKSVYVRGVTQVGFTAEAIATITFTLPASGSALQLVTSGSQIDNGQAGVQFTMNPSGQGTPMVGTAVQMDMNVTGMVYNGN